MTDLSALSSSSAVAAEHATVVAALAVADVGAYKGMGGEYRGGSAAIEIPGQSICSKHCTIQWHKAITEAA